MDTISQMATSAAKMAFGDQQAEPISGAQGNVAKGEPYDAGNLEPEDQERLHQSLKSNEPRDFDPAVGAYSTGGRNTESAYKSLPDESGRDVPKTQKIGGLMTSSGLTTQNQDMGGARHTSHQGVDGSSLDNTSRTNTTDQGWGGNNTDVTSNTASHHDMNKDTSETSTNTLDSQYAERSSSQLPASTKDDEPEKDVSGPGPRDLATLARENGGNAANSGSDVTSSTSGGNGLGDGNASKEEGTGELYVKSSGLQADGGDFDATKPGAGREADRLMEEKGISSSSGHGGNSDKTSHESGDKEKLSIMDKIKEKLHKS